MTILISGGGIAGLALGLTCHQIGVPFRIFESVDRIRPLGVGINLQPTAVRELFDLGVKDPLSKIGVRTQDFGLYSKLGKKVWTEPRGTWAGYNWPQFSVHRGALHMMLYETLLDRAGPECVETGWSVASFENFEDHVAVELKNSRAETRSVEGDLLVGADGIHSTVRAQMEPDEGPPHWGGSLLWRGTTVAKPFLSGASMVMIGYAGLRFVSYPISPPDAQTGNATINWIANLEVDASSGYRREDYSRRANLDDFLPRFRDLDVDWIDIPGLIENAGTIYEYPMVDRNPIDVWTHGRATLMGDAAHAAYPVGSNGAGSAIIDARKIGAAVLAHGITTKALQAYEEAVRPGANNVILVNRTAGPDSILDRVEDLSGGAFDDIDDVIPKAQMAAHADKYKAAAGFSVDATNAAPPTIPPGSRV